MLATPVLSRVARGYLHTLLGKHNASYVPRFAYALQMVRRVERAMTTDWNSNIAAQTEGPLERQEMVANAFSTRQDITHAPEMSATTRHSAGFPESPSGITPND